ncbi:hypothetical protein F5Y06DRAFT_305572 [Hypoxylon sp. FL0890]|nr:hypothetical protein F5Y06DRAFT_305572 [Hypoxylon sp. FL0890]
MESLFDPLAPEVITLVGSLLDLPSLRSIRLASRPLKLKFTPCFLRYFDIQNVDLTQQGFQRLKDLSSSPDISRSVHTLNLTCVHYHFPPSHEEILGGLEISWKSTTNHPQKNQDHHGMSLVEGEEKKTWMAEQQIQQAGLTGLSMYEQLTQALLALNNLQVITLEAVVVCGPATRCGPEETQYLVWRKLWAQAIQAFRVVMRAISDSEANIQSLIIYQKTKKCSIPTNEVAAAIATTIREDGETGNYRSIKKLAISVATTVVPCRVTKGLCADANFFELFDLTKGRMLNADDPEVDANADVKGVVDLLRLMPMLNSLEIHLYNTTSSTDIPEELPYQLFLSSLFQDRLFPHLERLTLRGLPTTAETMVHIFSTNNRLRYLGLQNVYLTSKSWDYVLDAAVKSCAALEKVQLSNLWRPRGESGGVTNLDYYQITSRKLDSSDPDMRQKRFSCGPDYYVWHTRDIDKGEIEEQGMIDFNASAYSGRGMASWDADCWIRAWMLESGPP